MLATGLGFFAAAAAVFYLSDPPSRSPFVSVSYSRRLFIHDKHGMCHGF